MLPKVNVPSPFLQIPVHSSEKLTGDFRKGAGGLQGILLLSVLAYVNAPCVHSTYEALAQNLTKLPNFRHTPYYNL